MRRRDLRHLDPPRHSSGDERVPVLQRDSDKQTSRPVTRERGDRATQHQNTRLDAVPHLSHSHKLTIYPKILQNV